ncbi:hypothetical protein GGS23DRAFT_219023 [Durotheca rogersii]|uniref:uncharacterized protein n=1 Tax=Durotheca rogersii TaxID=419775 RepID=UPI00221FC5C5|nr:uncharacterized protein GGS23DRAFT_219023 [Durotheca rogersii]KAI5860659.1 hypothetical protein GGS23DRAFT_219023 [Durotheca rogersii]
MKPSATFILAVAPSVSFAQWWKGAPACAQSCLSSAWQSPSGTVASGWPEQSTYCDGSGPGVSAASCISTACSATSTAYQSYSALSSSLCSAYAACTSAGSTGVRTITFPGGPVTWAVPGGWVGGGSKVFGGGGGDESNNGGNGTDSWDGPGAGTATDGGHHYWSEWASAYASSRTWTGGVATVTGCAAFGGSPWFVGPGCGWNGFGGFDGWVGWGSGWSWGPTTTRTVTYTTTDAADGTVTTGTGLAAVALAVSGTLTTSTTLGTPTPTDGAESGAAPRLAAPAAARLAKAGEGSAVTALVGLVLGTVVVVAGML